MKTLLTTFLLISSLMFSSFSETDIKNIIEGELKTTATFDGAEGDYLFFTDENNRALQFDSIDEKVTKTYNLIENNHIGETFEIAFKESKVLKLKPIQTTRR